MNEIATTKYREAMAAFDGYMPQYSENLALVNIQEQYARNSFSAAITANDKLLDCNPESLAWAAYQSLMIGLPPVNQLAYLIPYSGKATYQIGYRGMVLLAIKYTEATDVSAAIVYEGDEFVPTLGSSPSIHHVMHRGPAPGQPQMVYAILHGFEHPVFAQPAYWSEIQELMDMPVPKRNDGKKIGDTPAWRNWPFQMAMKFMVKRSCKLVPVGPELAMAIEHDNKLESGTLTEKDITPPGPDPDPADKTAGTRMLADKLKSKAGQTLAGVLKEAAQLPTDKRLDRLNEISVEFEMKHDGGMDNHAYVKGSELIKNAIEEARQ